MIVIYTVQKVLPGSTVESQQSWQGWGNYQPAKLLRRAGIMYLPDSSNAHTVKAAIEAAHAGWYAATWRTKPGPERLPIVRRCGSLRAERLRVLAALQRAADRGIVADVETKKMKAELRDLDRRFEECRSERREKLAQLGIGLSKRPRR